MVLNQQIIDVRIPSILTRNADLVQENLIKFITLYILPTDEFEPLLFHSPSYKI